MKLDKAKLWICRGSNPGPFACKANVIPLHYKPMAGSLSSILVYKSNSILVLLSIPYTKSESLELMDSSFVHKIDV